MFLLRDKQLVESEIEPKAETRNRVKVLVYKPKRDTFYYFDSFTYKFFSYLYICSFL